MWPIKGKYNNESVTFTMHNAYINMEVLEKAMFNACEKCPRLLDCANFIKKHPIAKENGCSNFPIVKKKIIKKNNEGIFYF